MAEADGKSKQGAASAQPDDDVPAGYMRADDGKLYPARTVAGTFAITGGTDVAGRLGVSLEGEAAEGYARLLQADAKKKEDAAAGGAAKAMAKAAKLRKRNRKMAKEFIRRRTPKKSDTARKSDSDLMAEIGEGLKRPFKPLKR